MYISWWSFFFFKQKPAYEVRIGDWSSDVCSSDLIGALRGGSRPACCARRRRSASRRRRGRPRTARGGASGRCSSRRDRKSGVQGQSASVRVDLGGRRIIKKKQKKDTCNNTITISSLSHLVRCFT